jgi:hypothetical protein
MSNTPSEKTDGSLALKDQSQPKKRGFFSRGHKSSSAQANNDNASTDEKSPRQSDTTATEGDALVAPPEPALQPVGFLEMFRYAKWLNLSNK